MNEQSTHRAQRRRSGTGGGLILLVLGVILFLNQAYGFNLFASFGTAFGAIMGSAGTYLVPLILIVLGVAIVFRGSR